MEIIYCAYDGTIFDDKKDCEKYEERFDKMKKEVHIYDKDFKELSFDDTGWEGKICFFKCETEESFNIFVEYFCCDVIYEYFEKLDLFFAEYDSDLFMTVRSYENSLSYNYPNTLGNSYLIAKDFQERLEKGE